MKYRVEYDTLYTGGNYSHVGEFCTVDAVSDEDVPAAFSQQTQIDPIHIVHFTLVNED